MKIAIDLRSLSSGSFSGVENYTINLVESVLKQDKNNQYVLFYNGFNTRLAEDFKYVNSRMAAGRIPNKILNLAFKSALYSLEKLTGPVDWFFMPNLNQFHVSGKTKVAITVHDLSPVVAPEFYDAKRRVWHWFLNYSKAFRRADLIFAVSEYTKSDIMRLFNVPDAKIKVVHPGLETESLITGASEKELRRVRNAYGLPGQYLLFLNTIEPRKNLNTLVDSFEMLNNSECHLVIAGRPGWKYGNIFKKIRNSKKHNRIRYLNYVPQKDKAAIIKLADALIYPSYYEGFGFQPLEAFSLGTPVVASQMTSMPEIVADAGLLVNPYNPQDLAVAINQVLKDQELRSILIKKGYERIKDFNWQRAGRQVLEALN
jgi:glycosyltransferase involved in cell wall biosynthesis